MNVRARSGEMPSYRPAIAIGMVAMLAAAALAAQHAGPEDVPERGESGVYKATERPLDPRIDGNRMTETEPPPLPELVVLPKPPLFRISAAPEEVSVISEEHWQRARQSIERGVAFLQRQQDEQTGLWLAGAEAAPTGSPDEPSPVSAAVSALAMRAIVQAEGGQALVRDEVQAALRAISGMQNEDGSFKGGALTNYVTSAVVSAFAALDDTQYSEEIRQAVTWLQSNQWHQQHGVSPEHDWFGGAGYGKHGRPDMSNTQMMLDALYDAGLSPDEPAFQRAIAFASRAQNLRATNASEWAGDDGGFVYTPANGGESMASEAVGEGRRGELLPEGQPRSLRSYGSMTYAGFKSMLYAGMSVNDIRVRSAFEWIRRHWTFEANPGLGQQGLYYYYHTMARALVIAQQHEITDIDGEKHNWREEMIDAIIVRQRDDGSWTNPAERWMEGEPVMATIYAVLALEEMLKPVFVLE